MMQLTKGVGANPMIAKCKASTVTTVSCPLIFSISREHSIHLGSLFMLIYPWEKFAKEN